MNMAPQELERSASKYASDAYLLADFSSSCGAIFIEITYNPV